MKILLALIIFCIATAVLSAQTIFFALDNATVISQSGIYYYEVDVTARSGNTGFALGSGQLYFNYNTTAFGENIVRNGNLTITASNDYLMATKTSFGFDFYNSKVRNDNTSDRFSYSWQQADFSSGCLGSNTLSSAAKKIFRIRIRFQPGEQDTDPGLCYESASIYTNQTFTACGSSGECASKNCTDHTDEQITDDFFDCSGGTVLPVELIDFQAQATPEGQVALNWQTATELNNDYFAVERSTNGLQFEELFRVRGAGTTTEEQHYLVFDEAPLNGNNYYRLRQVDFDGTFEYSDIRVVNFAETSSTNIDLYPNPASTWVFVRFGEPLPADSRVRLLDAAGRLALDLKLDTAANFLRLDLRELPPGVYMLQVPGSTGSLLGQKVVLQ